MKRLLPLLALLLIAASGLVAAAVVLRLDQSNKRLAFEAVAEQGLNRLREQTSRHMLLLAATAAHFESAHGWITAREFRTYVDRLVLPERAPGSVGLGYLVFADRSQLPELSTAYAANNGAKLDLWPDTNAPRMAVAVLFEAVDGQDARASGFDSYSEPDRREAIDRAIARGEPSATGPLEPVRGPGKGPLTIVVYLPVHAALFGIDATPGTNGSATGRPAGFVSAVFRAGAFIDAAFERAAPRAHIVVADAARPNLPLGEVGAPADPRFSEAFVVRDELEFGGRTWIVTARPSIDFRAPSAAPFALALGVLSVLLACAVAATLREQARAHAATEALATTSQRNLEEKDLMLQEMKHRIKNAIGRILAMARQTASNSADMDAFLQSFTQRLQAMSNAQDVLTRSRYLRADLGELLRQELAQVFGHGFDDGRLSGPPIELDERSAQALGLTIHELATNTLKYSGGAPDIDVSWHAAPSPAGAEELVLHWQERAVAPVAQPERTGFGTRLIDMNIRHELGGEIERNYAETGLRVTLTIPLRDGVIGGRPGGTIGGKAR
ncbi:CHASE domain-containing protein [Amaricoccus sp. W119]|uniref:CHASE domain-containing protein n=1 Tax=Amaricoccus sp. W119 TaxID=3391833 RepID=UPI0039A685B6